MLLLENISHEELKKNIKELYDYAIQFLEIDRAPKIVFKKNKKNAEDLFGKTGYYDPDSETIALYITDRHAKDILRSFAHELVHHKQKCTGQNDELDLSLTATDPAYAMHDDGLRDMEREAFTEGNLIFRDWCDTKKMERKNTMAESKNVIDVILDRVTKRLIQEAKKPMKDEPKGQDLNGDGKKGSGKVPAFLDAGDAEQKKSSGKVPKQLQKFVKKKARKEAKQTAKKTNGTRSIKEDESFGNIGDDPSTMEESYKHPHPVLLDKKERLFNERFNTYEEWKFQELLKRAIK